MSTLMQQNWQHLTASSQPVNSDDFSQAGLPEFNATSADHQSESVNATSPGLASPGLRSILSADSEGKEAYRNSQIRNSTEKEMGSPSVVEDHKEVAHAAPERKKRRPWLFLILGALACLVIGLAVGLGVGLTRKSSKPSTVTSAPTQPSSGGVTSPNPTDVSTVGAFNGSGLAVASQSFGSEVTGNGTYGKLVMYFQHHTGSIRTMQLRDNGWEGGQESDIVVGEGVAKNGTPISAVSYALDDVAAWHIFYIAVNNTLQEITNSNTTNEWAPGPINNLNLQVMDDPNVGLQGCWYGSYYSAASNVNSSDKTVGIHLWYGKNSTAFGAVGWTAGDMEWTLDRDFDGYNGHAGVGCYTWAPNSTTNYLMLVNLQNEVNILWKDLNATLNSTPTHPIGSWVTSNVTLPVFQNTSLGYTDFLFAQNPDLSISGWNISYSAENTSVVSGQGQEFNISVYGAVNDGTGIPGTHLTCTALPDQSGGASLEAYYQTNGSNIENAHRDLLGGPWYIDDLPVPAS